MIISALDKKMLRDLWEIRGQAFAITLVIAAGIATFVMSLSALNSLEESQQLYYQRYRFADVFSRVKRAPETLLDRLREIPGVAQVQTRIVYDVTIDVPDMVEPAVGRLISIPEIGRPTLNDVHLRKGRYLEPGREREVLVSEPFAEVHELKPGDSISAIINGRRQELTIVGIALSPEYIIQIGGGSLLPDNERFGVFWMSRRQLEAAFDMDGAFNDVTLTLMRGANEEEVIDRVDALLDPYGSIGADDRGSQLSHQYITDEIRQLNSMALISPSIFLSVAAFLLNVVISRMVGMQREQIAALKAFGYFNWQVGLHYLKLVLVIAIGGVVLGTLFGLWMGRNLTLMYAEFYRFPIFEFRFDTSSIALAAVLSVVAATLGTWAAVSRAIRLPPAEAMRPEPPASFHTTLIERMGLKRFVPQVARMILRSLQRRPVKTMIATAGIAMAVAVLILGSFSLDAIRYIMDFQFRVAQRQDVMLTFFEPIEGEVRHEIDRLTGVMQSEPFRAVPVRLQSAHYQRRVSIMGLSPDPELFRLMDVDEQQVPVPPEGLMLNDKLAELLHVGLGDPVEVQVLEGERPNRVLPVRAIIKEYGGTNAYMNRFALNDLMDEGESLSGAFVKVDGRRLEDLYHQLKQIPRVGGITIKSAALESFEETVAENLLTMRLFNIGFATVIAFGVVYNTARISLSEQSRELATLRVMGFTRHEVSAILLGELAILTAVAIPLGWLIGYGFAALVTTGLDTEVYRIPLVVERSTFVFAALTVIIAAFLSGLVVRRRIDHLDLIAVLKTRE